MFKLLQYIASAQGVLATIRALPLWARIIFVLFALPGIVLLALSLVALSVSIAALLLLTVPVYRLLRLVSGPQPAAMMPEPGVASVFDVPPPESTAPNPRRKIDVTIIE